MSKPKLLITGASGFLGWHLCQHSQNNWDVYGINHTKTIQIPGTTVLNVNLTDEIALQSTLAQLKPDAVVHAAALSQPNACALDPALSMAMNVQASWQIADYCAEQAIPCVFTSTDQVFDGHHAPYRETAPVAPVNLYGEHKVMAEEGMRSRYPLTTVCRLPLMYGKSPYASSFLQGFLQKLQAGQTLQLFTDEFRTPASGASVAQGILLALGAGVEYLHLGGPERLSRYSFGQLLVEILGLPETLLQPCLQADVPMPAARPGDVALDSTLAFGLGYRPLAIQPELAAMIHSS